MPKKKKKFEVKIAWGSSTTREDNEGKEITYRFDTQAEVDAFLKGVDEACGWSDYEVAVPPESIEDIE